MTKTQIEAFLALCKYQNVSVAAEKLYVTQPAISRMIKALEEDLGYALFVRKKGVRRLELTEKGELFYSVAYKMDNLYSQAKLIAESTAHKIYRIATADSFSAIMLPKVYELLCSSDVNFTIDIVHSSEAFRQVQNNHADMAFVTNRYSSPAVECVPLFREKVVLICSRNLLPDGPVRVRQLDPSQAIATAWSPEFETWFEYWFGRDRYDMPRLQIKVGNHIQYYGRTKPFWAFLPLMSAKGNLLSSCEFDLHEVEESPPDRVCYCIYRREGNESIRDEVLSAAKQALRSMPDIDILL